MVYDSGQVRLRLRVQLGSSVQVRKVGSDWLFNLCDCVWSYLILFGLIAKSITWVSYQCGLAYFIDLFTVSID